MLFLPGIDSKSYWTRLGRGMAIPAVACPDPSCPGVLSARGWYQRYLGGERVSLRRLRCRRCGVSHALLPEDVCAYRDLTFPVLEAAMHSRDGPSAAARAAGRQGPAAVRQARRWLRGSSWQRLSMLLPAAGRVWERIEAIVGPVPGQLVRLRHWLWSKLGYLLGGPTGLFRHGRPAAPVRGVAP